MGGIRSDSKRAGKKPDDDIKNSEKKVGGDKKVTGLFDGLTAGFCIGGDSGLSGRLCGRSIVGFFHSFILALLLL